MMAVPDARDLEGRKDGQVSAPQSRDFFWDSLTLFVVAAVLSLTAVDVISEYIRGSDVQCFLPNNTDALASVQKYVNEKCAGSLPAAQYLPAFIAIHAILILAPHYIWLNLFGANLDFFFHHASKLARVRDPKTGDYPKTNYVISKQLEYAFKTGGHRPNAMYKLYTLKLIAQVLISGGGFAIVCGLFTDYNETFSCPSESSDTLNMDWPLPYEQVVCVFSSLQLLHKIWIIYLILLGTATLCLFIALLWLTKEHLSELGIENEASFCFETSVPLHNYIPQSSITKVISRSWLRKVLSYIPSYSLKSGNLYRIQSDYDFLLIKLFRTEGGFAYILREIHVTRLIKEYNDLELAALRINLEEIDEEEKVSEALKSDFLFGTLGWEVRERYEEHKQFNKNVWLTLPPYIRGVVLGLSMYCEGSSIVAPDKTCTPKQLSGALCIQFDSDSVGFAGALARVFSRVAVLNFSHFYSDYENPVYLSVKSSTQVAFITAPHDILMTDCDVTSHHGEPTTAVKKFYQDLNEVWRPNFIYTSKKYNIITATGKTTLYPTDYIVIGPISGPLQIATVNILLKKYRRMLHLISQNAILVTITPEEKAGDTVEFESDLQMTNFHKHAICAKLALPSSDRLEWPPTGEGSTVHKQSCFPWNVKTGASESGFLFRIFNASSN